MVREAPSLLTLSLAEDVRVSEMTSDFVSDDELVTVFDRDDISSDSLNVKDGDVETLNVLVILPVTEGVGVTLADAVFDATVAVVERLEDTSSDTVAL